MTRRRRILAALAFPAGLVVLAGVSAVLIVRSDWFFEKVRRKLVETVETATGGRVEAGAVSFDWSRLRAEVRDFTLHGTEPSGKPSLFHASSVAVGLKIISAWKRDFDVQYADVAGPHIYLIIDPDGRTNIPEPKIKKHHDRNTLETILDLKIGRFNLAQGIFEIENRGRTPFEAHGQNLRAAFRFDRSGPRYAGDLSIQPLAVTFPEIGAGKPVPFGVEMKLALEGNRIGVTSGRLTTGDTQVDLTGGLEDLVTPRLSFRYTAHAAIPDVARALRVPELQAGRADLTGQAAWSEASGFTASGDLHAYGFEYRDSTLVLRDGRAEGKYSVAEPGVDVTGLKLSANYVRGSSRVPVDGNIAQVAIHQRDLDIRGVGLALLGGSFHGEAQVRNLDRYRIDGEIAGFEIRRGISIYSPQRLPWDARASGAVRLESSLHRKKELTLTAGLTIDPAVQGPPVHGRITGVYTAADGVLDVGRSTLSLPSSQVDFSGTLPPGPGHEMHVNLQTRDLDDFLPALGASAAELPVKLTGGSVAFDGTVTGDLDNPQIDGRLRATSFAYTGQAFDSLDGSVRVSPATAELHDATVARGALRARLTAVVGLHEWKADDASPIAGSVQVRDADLREILNAAKAGGIQATGFLTASARVAGTIGQPVASSEIEIVKGALYDEPFDAFHARASYTGQKLELQSGELLAGTSRVQLTGTYEHTAGRIDAGRLKFNLSSNDVPLERIQTLRRMRPGARGTLQGTARGDVELKPAAARGPLNLRIADLHADLVARGLQLTGQTLGDAHLTADSQGQALLTHLESDFANSTIRGDGAWNLEGDIPGTATIKFARLDFAQLRQWISPTEGGAAPFSGAAEGELHIEGPALKPEAMKAELRLPKFQLGPAAGTGAPAAALAVENNGDIVATLANSVVTVEHARLKGRTTDLNVSGRVLLQQKNPLDLHINGTIDLDLAHDFLPDLIARGTLTTDTTVRGALDSPQIVGHLQFQDASFNIGDLPNGISEANAVIQFTGDRATIQTFTGVTGGGRIELSGFVGYSGDGILFRLHAEAATVRVRVPEGVSVVANASLDFTGTEDRSMLSGGISIVRTGFNLQSDFSSVIAKSAEPVQTPSARTGLLGGMNFDIHVSTAPDVQLQSSLTQDLQAEANLQLRGTVSNPALVGRITITQGQLLFYGTKFTINQGSISFYNPVKIEPFLDIDLETKAKGIDITLTVQGPLNKPTLTPRSDPPLQFPEIVALLATGSTPTSDPAMLARQNTTPNSWQQTGASALLGQAIASPVSGRLQRFFGVSKLRIDPTLPGIESNPQARLTLEQQVTPDVTFTYITNLTNSNPQVVRVEWALNKRWSVVSLRDENGTFGIDFFFKRQF